MRMIATALVTLALLGPVSADAQDSHTTCFANGNVVNCSTHTYQNTGGAAGGFAQGLHDSLQRNRGRGQIDLGAIMARHHERNEERARQQRYVTTGKLIDAGKCPEARSFALTSGDLNLAQRVDALCPPSPTQ